MVLALTTWAHDHHLDGAELTVLVIDPFPAPRATDDPADGYAFTTIPVP